MAVPWSDSPWPSPDYETPSPRSQAIIAVNVLFSILATIVVFVRLFTRSKLLHSVGIDDWLIIVGLALAWVLALWNSLGTAWGLGRHAWDIPKENWIGVGKIIWGTTSMYFPTLGFIKLSILFSWRRITPSAFGRSIIYYTMTFVALLTISVTFANTFQCNPLSKIYTPVPGKSWVEWGDRQEGTCINRPVLFYVSGGLNVLSDLVILAIPMPMLIGLGWPWRQKVALVALFSLGGIACIASVARLGVLHELLYSPDLTWVIYKYSITSCMEISLGIICASVPSLKPFLVKYLPYLLGNDLHSNHIRGSKAWSIGSSIVQRKPTGDYNALRNVDESGIGGPERGGRLGTGRLSWYSEQVLKAEEEARKYQATQEAEEAIRKKMKKREDSMENNKIKRMSTWRSIASSISRSATHLSRSATRRMESGSVAMGPVVEKQYDPAATHGSSNVVTNASFNDTVPPLPPLPPVIQSSPENNTTDSATATLDSPYPHSNPVSYITAPPHTSRQYKSLPYKLSTQTTKYHSLPNSDSEFLAPKNQSPTNTPSPKSPLQRLGTWGVSKYNQLRGGETSTEVFPPPPDAQYSLSRRHDSNSETSILVMVPKGTGAANRDESMDICEDSHAEDGTGSLIKGAAGRGEGGSRQDGKPGGALSLNTQAVGRKIPVPDSPLQFEVGSRLDGPGEFMDFTYY